MRTEVARTAQVLHLLTRHPQWQREEIDAGIQLVKQKVLGAPPGDITGG